LIKKSKELLENKIGERKSLINHDSITGKFVFSVNEFHFMRGVPLKFVFLSSCKKKKKQTEVENEKFVGLILFFESIYLHFTLIYLLLIL